MGKILSGYLMPPHPPIIVEEIGRGQERKAINTIEGCRTIAKDIKEKKTYYYYNHNSPWSFIFRCNLHIRIRKIRRRF